MNTEIESLFPEEGEVIETENPRRNFNEVSLLIFLFLLCRNKHIDNITKFFVTITLFLSISHANCQRFNFLSSNLASDLKSAHHALYAKTATSLKVAHYDCSLMDSNKMYSLNKVAPCKIEPQNVEISKVRWQIFFSLYYLYNIPEQLVANKTPLQRGQFD